MFRVRYTGKGVQLETLYKYSDSPGNKFSSNAPVKKDNILIRLKYIFNTLTRVTIVTCLCLVLPLFIAN